MPFFATAPLSSLTYSKKICSARLILINLGYFPVVFHALFTDLFISKSCIVIAELFSFIANKIKYNIKLYCIECIVVCCLKCESQIVYFVNSNSTF